MKIMRKKRQFGFTTIELVIVFGLFVILAGFSAPSLLNLRNRTSLNTALEAFVNEVRQEQYAAMIEGKDKTITFGLDYYQLGDFRVNLDSNLQFGNIAFPNQELIFASYSGEIKDYISGQNTIIMHDLATQDAKIINFNRLGTITEIL